MGDNLGTGGPLSVIPVRSGHGDVHDLIVGRSNGDSITLQEFRRVFAAVTGRELDNHEVLVWSDWFAEEDR